VFPWARNFTLAPAIQLLNRGHIVIACSRAQLKKQPMAEAVIPVKITSIKCIKPFKFSSLYILSCQHKWPDFKKPGFHTHNIKLTILPEMNYWRNAISYSTAGLAPKPRVWFLWQLFLDPQVALWRHWIVMALLYWCLEGWTSHEGLANVCYVQFGVLWAQEGSSRAPNWTSGLQLSSYSILYSYINPPSSPTHHPYYYHLQYHNRHEKAAQNSLNFGCLKVIHPHNYS